jgi:hypothetical protein
VAEIPQARKPGKPMITVVNEANERTHRLTGMPREEIVRRAWGKGDIPLYAGSPTIGLWSHLGRVSAQ